MQNSSSSTPGQCQVHRDVTPCRWVTDSRNRRRNVGKHPPNDTASHPSSGVPGNYVRGGGSLTNSVEDRGQTERGSGGGSPLVRGSGGSCNLVQEISFHIVKFSEFRGVRTPPPKPPSVRTASETTRSLKPLLVWRR